MKKLLIIDTFNFLHRAYHALPKTFTNAQGQPTNAVYGVTSMIISILEHIQPNYFIAALDSKEPTIRVSDFTAYKAHRRPMEDDLSTQIPLVFEVMDAFGITKITVPGYEADDVIGTVCAKHPELEIVIASNDRDLWQLLNDHTTVMIPSTKGPAEFIGKKEAEARLGFSVDLIPDYKGIRGDPSDNIPGVYGIGEKGATKLIQEFGTVEEIYKNLSQVKPDSTQKKLAVCAEQAVMSKNLATIMKDIPLTFDIEDSVYSGFGTNQVRDVLEKNSFKSLLRRLDLPEGQLSLF